MKSLTNITPYFHKLCEIDTDLIDSDQILKRENIKLLSYNLFMRPPPVKNNENDWKDERLADFVKCFKNYDIICLQEMFDTFSCRRQHLINLAFDSGLFFYVESVPPSFFSKSTVDAGLLLISRFPIVESEFRPFKYTVLSCSTAEKGILYAKIKIKDSYLIVFNTHLQATYTDYKNFNEFYREDFKLCIDTRMKQIEEASEFILEIMKERKIGKNDKVVLTGDFNIDANSMKSKYKKYFGGEFDDFKDKMSCEENGENGENRENEESNKNKNKIVRNKDNINNNSENTKNSSNCNSDCYCDSDTENSSKNNSKVKKDGKIKKLGKVAKTDDVRNSRTNTTTTTKKDDIRNSISNSTSNSSSISSTNSNNFENSIQSLRKIFYNIVKNEYSDMVSILNKRFIASDTWKKHLDHFPITYGRTGSDQNSKYDTVLTSKNDYECTQTLDYIFELYTDSEDHSFSNKKPLQITTISTEEFLITKRPYQQLSDHFGVVIDIICNI